jgi:hypothetical protein
MVRHTIDWSTASVSRGASGFDLTVELDCVASPDWQACFNQLAEQDALSAQRRTWTVVCVSERAITMEHLEPDERERVRSYLGEIVERTNHAVAAKLDEEERERVRAEREEAEVARAAEELAGWFRAAPPATDSVGGKALPNGGAAADAKRSGDQVADLRNRLKHAFGAGS